MAKKGVAADMRFGASRGEVGRSDDGRPSRGEVGRSDDANRLWPPAFKAAIFDFDGTISDTASLWKRVDLAFLGARGIPYSPDYGRALSALGFAAGAQYTIERYGLRESVQEICDEWNRMGRALYEAEACLRPGAEAYIRDLGQAGIPCALATTNDRAVLDAMRKVKVDDLFDVRLHAGELGVAKDVPDIYQEAARQLGQEPADCIVFEDLAVALRSARQAGCVTCGVRSNDPHQEVDEMRSICDLWLDGWEGVGL